MTIEDKHARFDALVSKAIATAPRSRPPPGFAAAIASRAAAREAGLEPALIRGLMLVLGVALALVAVPFAAPAWRALREGLAGGGMLWAAAGAACVVASWAVGQVRQIRAIPAGGRQR